jgi:hypothetical protein
MRSSIFPSAINKKAPQIIDLQGLISGGGDESSIEHLSYLLSLIQQLKH